MNILIQAYACAADKGGEFSVSWGWIRQLDKRVQEQDKIFVCSLTLTEHEIEKSGLKHVELIPVDNLDKFMKYSSKQSDLAIFSLSNSKEKKFKTGCNTLLFTIGF